jgi:hypothetical protein
VRARVQLHFPAKFLLVAVCCLACMLNRSLVFAQSSGPTVDVCSSGQVDSSNGIEETVCLQGDASQLEGSASAYASGNPIAYGLDAQMYDNGNLGHRHRRAWLFLRGD